MVDMFLLCLRENQDVIEVDEEELIQHVEKDIFYQRLVAFNTPLGLLNHMLKLNHMLSIAKVKLGKDPSSVEWTKDCIEEGKRVLILGSDVIQGLIIYTGQKESDQLPGVHQCTSLQPPVPARIGVHTSKAENPQGGGQCRSHRGNEHAAY